MVHFNNLFRQNKPVIAMVHLMALPGTPANSLKPAEIIQMALNEAENYVKYGVDAIMIENMHDRPYLKTKATPECISLMSIIGYEIKKQFNIPVGIQILAAANIDAIAAALGAGLGFIRAEGFVFGHVADEGYIDGCAAELLRYRKNIDAEHIAIFTDIKKKHSSHAITSDVSIAETAKAAEFFLSDGIIITGSSTGQEALVSEVSEAKNATSLPIIIGSGINIENISRYYAMADGFIVGSHFKVKNQWYNPVDGNKVKQFMHVLQNLKKSQNG